MRSPSKRNASLLASFRGTADWFGVSKDSDATQKWQRKSLRHCSLRYGKLKPQVIREMDLPSQDNISLTSTETPPPLYVGPCQLGMQKVSNLGQSQGHPEFPAQRLYHFGSCDLSAGLALPEHVWAPCSDVSQVSDSLADSLLQQSLSSLVGWDPSAVSVRGSGPCLSCCDYGGD